MALGDGPGTGGQQAGKHNGFEQIPGHDDSSVKNEYH
jgi:hypothetical protein